MTVTTEKLKDWAMVYTKLSVRFRLYTVKSHGRLSKKLPDKQFVPYGQTLGVRGFLKPITSLHVEFVSVNNFAYSCGKKIL